MQDAKKTSSDSSDFHLLLLVNPKTREVWFNTWNVSSFTDALYNPPLSQTTLWYHLTPQKVFLTSLIIQSLLLKVVKCCENEISPQVMLPPQLLFEKPAKLVGVSAFMCAPPLSFSLRLSFSHTKNMTSISKEIKPSQERLLAQQHVS